MKQTVFQSPRPLRERARVRGKKAAFTLAEVLITLGIIGVVAALTMPSLITKHQKNVTVNSLKKFYSALSQAKTLSETVNGPLANWEFKPVGNKQYRRDDFDKYFRPYLNIVDECKSAEQCKIAELLQGNFVRAPFYIMNNGTIFMISCSNESETSEHGCYVIADINGNKGPNVYGKDIFFMDIFDRQGLVMLGMYPDDGKSMTPVTRDELKNGTLINTSQETPDTACCNTTCATDGYKYYTCGALIQVDGWKIADDYPW